MFIFLHTYIQGPRGYIIGGLHSRGPGTYKLPSFNDTPRELHVRLMSGVDNKVAVHSSKAVGEPPFFLGGITFFAIRNAVAAARAEHAHGKAVAPDAVPHFTFNSPATSERIRMACGDIHALRAIGEGAKPGDDALAVRGSF